MKKLSSFGLPLLAALLAFSFTSCSKNDDSSNDVPANASCENSILGTWKSVKWLDQNGNDVTADILGYFQFTFKTGGNLDFYLVDNFDNQTDIYSGSANYLLSSDCKKISFCPGSATQCSSQELAGSENYYTILSVSSTELVLKPAPGMDIDFINNSQGITFKKQ